jgi:O-antigen/teichoic acid export membrane protein
LQIQNTSAFHSSAWTIGAKFIERGAALVVYILLARYLTLEEFGIVTLALLYLEFVGSVVNSGFRDYIVTHQQPSKRLVNTCLLMVVGMSAFASLVLGLAIYTLMPEYSESSKQILYALLFYPVFITYNSIQKALIQRALLFKRLSLIRAISCAVSGVVSVYLAFEGFGAWALVVFHYLQICIDIVLMSFLVLLLPRLSFSIDEAKASLAFSVPLAISEALNYWSSRVMELFVSLYFGPAGYAVLSIARKFSKLVEQLSLSALRPVFLPFITKASDKGEAFAKYTAAISFFVIPVLIALGVYADYYVVFIFSEQWQSAVIVVQIIAFMAVAQCLMSYFTVLLVANKRSGLVLKTNLVFFSIAVMAGAFGFSLNLEEYLILQIAVFNIIALLKLLYLLKERFISRKVVMQYFVPLLAAVIVFTCSSLLAETFVIEPFSIANIDNTLMTFILSVFSSIFCFALYAAFTKLCFSSFFSSALSKITLQKSR